MTEPTTPQPDRPMHAVVQTRDGYTAHAGLMEDCTHSECVAATTLAAAHARAEAAEAEVAENTRVLAALRRQRDRAEAALARVRDECDRIEEAVRSNPQDPDFDGAYLASIQHIRAALDDDQPAEAQPRLGRCAICGAIAYLYTPRQAGPVCADCLNCGCGETPCARTGVNDPAVSAEAAARDDANRIVAHRSLLSKGFFCTACAPADRTTPLTSDDLPDGGICCACGADVLIEPEVDQSANKRRVAQCWRNDAHSPHTWSWRGPSDAANCPGLTEAEPEPVDDELTADEARAEVDRLGREQDMATCRCECHQDATAPH